VGIARTDPPFVPRGTSAISCFLKCTLTLAQKRLRKRRREIEHGSVRQKKSDVRKSGGKIGAVRSKNTFSITAGKSRLSVTQSVKHPIAIRVNFALPVVPKTLRHHYG